MLKLPAWSGRGLVVAEHPLAALAGWEVLRRKGNFADAVVAVSAMLSVVAPHLCGLGGDFFGLFWLAGEKRSVSLNGSGQAPQKLTAKELRRRYKTALPAYSPLTVTVPGLVDALWQLHRQFGRLAWQELWKPAIEVAREGFPVSVKLATSLVASARRLAKDEGARQLFFRAGKPLMVGQTLRQPALANTMARIATEGRDAFYKSDLTKRMVACLQRRGTPITFDDFAAQKSQWDEPLVWRDGKYTVLEMPPNSLGIATLQSLALLRSFPLENMELTELAHLVSAVAQVVAQERDAYLADPRFMSLPPAALLNPSHLDTLRCRLFAPNSSPFPQSGDTTNFVVVDDDGNVASAIQSVFHHFGVGIVDPLTGVLFHNRGANFTLKAGHPNELGPGKRPRHTLSALIVLEGEMVKGALGTSGGDYRPTLQAWMLVHWLYRNQTLQEAMEMPRVLWQGERRVHIERGAGDPEKLQQWGWQVEVLPYPPLFGFGVAHGVERLRESWCGCADVRGEGIALPT